MNKPLSIAPAIVMALFWATLPVHGQSVLNGFDPNANSAVFSIAVQFDFLNPPIVHSHIDHFSSETGDA
jgi:hypothetical protein